MSNNPIKLPTVPKHRNAPLIRLWNYLTGKLPDNISQILLRMNPRKLFRFLEFMHMICLHDQTVFNSHERLEHYQTILMCCPRLILTRYLCSIDEQCVVDLLERCDVIWTMYFVGLIELGYNFEINMNFINLTMIYGPNFVLDLVLFLIREASNSDLPHHLRQNIFYFICQNPTIVLFIVERENEYQAPTIEESLLQMNQWSQRFSRRNDFALVPPQWSIDNFRMNQEPPQNHRRVNAKAFVCKTFPPHHPLAPDRVYECGICQCGPDDPNEDETLPVFRSMPCCPQQMACHCCLVRCATSCNTPDHQNEFKNTSIFVCPYCRAETGFFPDEN